MTSSNVSSIVPASRSIVKFTKLTLIASPVKGFTGRADTLETTLTALSFMSVNVKFPIAM